MPLEFRIDSRVHLVVVRHAHARVQHPAGVPQRDGRFPAAVHLHAAGIVHRRHAFIARSVAHPARHVAHTPVGILGAHHDLLLRAGFQGGQGREDFEARHRGIAVGWTWRARRDPFRDHAVFERIGGEPLAAAVRDRECGLQQHQAVRRLRKRNAPPDRLPRQRGVILFGIVAAQRELESVLARRRAMARSRIAAHFAHHGDDIVAKGPCI